MPAFVVRLDITFKLVRVPTLIVIWKHERLAEQSLRVLRGICESGGRGAFSLSRPKGGPIRESEVNAPHLLHCFSS